MEVVGHVLHLNNAHSIILHSTIIPKDLFDGWRRSQEAGEQPLGRCAPRPPRGGRPLSARRPASHPGGRFATRTLRPRALRSPTISAVSEQSSSRSARNTAPRGCRPGSSTRCAQQGRRRRAGCRPSARGGRRQRRRPARFPPGPREARRWHIRPRAAARPCGDRRQRRLRLAGGGRGEHRRPRGAPLAELDQRRRVRLGPAIRRAAATASTAASSSEPAASPSRVTDDQLGTHPRGGPDPGAGGDREPIRPARRTGKAAAAGRSPARLRPRPEPGRAPTPAARRERRRPPRALPRARAPPTRRPRRRG